MQKNEKLVWITVVYDNFVILYSSCPSSKEHMVPYMHPLYPHKNSVRQIVWREVWDQGYPVRLLAEQRYEPNTLWSNLTRTYEIPKPQRSQAKLYKELFKKNQLMLLCYWWWVLLILRSKWLAKDQPLNLLQGVFFYFKELEEGETSTLIFEMVRIKDFYQRHTSQCHCFAENDKELGLC